MKLSIVIVTYNSSDTISECLRSCVDQTDVEIIVADNHSSDNTAEIVAKYPSVRYLKQADNLGFNGGNAVGIAASSGPYVVLLNPDTILPKQFSERVIELFEADAQLGVLGFRMVNTDGSLQRTGNSFPTIRSLLHEHSAYHDLFPNSRAYKRYIIADWDRQTSRDIDAVSGACTAIRRSALEAIGGLDTDYFLFYEEFDLARRILKAGYKVHFDAETSVMHHSGTSTRKVPNAAIDKHYFASRDRYIRKHHGALYFWCFGVLLKGFGLLGRLLGKF